MADGHRLPLFVIFKGVRPIAELVKEFGIIVAYSNNGWINEGLTKDWVKRGWGTLSFGRRFTCVGCLEMPFNGQCEEYGYQPGQVRH